jgi:hypothetical protein
MDTVFKIQGGLKTFGQSIQTCFSHCGFKYVWYCPIRSTARITNVWKGTTIEIMKKFRVSTTIIQLWTQLPEDALGTLSYKPSGFRKRVRKVINRAK